MSDDGESVLVKLTRMEGKLDLSNLRHDQTDAWKTTVDGRLNTHGERIGGLEKREVGRDGERKGFIGAGKLAWGLSGLIGGGSLAVLLKTAFGL